MVDKFVNRLGDENKENNAQNQMVDILESKDQQVSNEELGEEYDDSNVNQGIFNAMGNSKDKAENYEKTMLSDVIQDTKDNIYNYPL